MPHHYIFLSSYSPGIRERKDGPQQQLQSLRKVHSGELPGEWHCQRVRDRRQIYFILKFYFIRLKLWYRFGNNLILLFFLPEHMWKNISWRSRDWSIRSTMSGEHSSEININYKTANLLKGFYCEIYNHLHLFCWQILQLLEQLLFDTCEIV